MQCLLGCDPCGWIQIQQSVQEVIGLLRHLVPAPLILRFWNILLSAAAPWLLLGVGDVYVGGVKGHGIIVWGRPPSQGLTQSPQVLTRELTAARHRFTCRDKQNVMGNVCLFTKGAIPFKPQNMIKKKEAVKCYTSLTRV